MLLVHKMCVVLDMRYLAKHNVSAIQPLCVRGADEELWYGWVSEWIGYAVWRLGQHLGDETNLGAVGAWTSVGHGKGAKATVLYRAHAVVHSESTVLSWLCVHVERCTFNVKFSSSNLAP